VKAFSLDERHFLVEALSEAFLLLENFCSCLPRQQQEIVGQQQSWASWDNMAGKMDENPIH
jgi:hypothetical protein